MLRYVPPKEDGTKEGPPKVRFVSNAYFTDVDAGHGWVPAQRPVITAHLRAKALDKFGLCWATPGVVEDVSAYLNSLVQDAYRRGGVCREPGGWIWVPNLVRVRR